MWRTFLLLSSLLVMIVFSRPLEDTSDDSVWISQFTSDHDLLRKLENAKSKKLFPEGESYKTEYSPEEFPYALMLALPPHDKRSLSMLAHWGALSNIGKQRSSVRELPRWNAIASDLNGITAETRARPGGQPLRWG